MTAKELLDILNNKYEIPSLEDAELCFYFTDDDGNEIDLKLDKIGAFYISTDITFGFVKDDNPIIIKPTGKTKQQLRKEMGDCHE